MALEIKKVALVLFDISGYTEFIRLNQGTLAHASEAIAQLLEHIVEGADFPLVLNKFDGDAAFMYAETQSDEKRAALQIAQQVLALVPGFRAKVAELAGGTTCLCDACQNITNLRLKAVVQAGDVAFRRIRQFEELTGEDVIIVHRLLKNSVSAKEYVLMTEAFSELLDPAMLSGSRMVTEVYEHLGPITLRAFSPT